MRSDASLAAKRPPRALVVVLAGLALLFNLLAGWLIQDRLSLLQRGLKLPAIVVGKQVQRVSADRAGDRSSLRLELLLSFQHPVDGSDQRQWVLAPLLYPLVEPGDRLTLIHAPLDRGRAEAFVLAHPLQLWLMPLLSLIVLALLLHGLRSLLQEQGTMRRLLLAGLGLSLCLPVLPVALRQWQFAAQAAADQGLEAGWPRWEALEREVPRPWWWSHLHWRGIDPLQADGEALHGLLRRTAALHAPGDAEMSFKLAWAATVRHHDDPLTLSSYLRRGHDPGFLPLYHFFLGQYMDRRWERPDCSRCADGSTLTEMAGLAMWMDLAAGRIGAAERWVEPILEHKFARADAAARLEFLRPYRALLEYRHGPGPARQLLDPWLQDTLQQARANGDTQAQRHCERFWQSAMPSLPSAHGGS